MVETVKYEVLRVLDKIELRRYPELLLAVVEGYEENTAFNILFNYIAGENSKRTKIAMTAPVITSEKIPMTAPVITQKNSMAFAMPSTYTINTLPVPTNRVVRIKRQPQKCFAVLRFSGASSQQRVDRFVHDIDRPKH